MKIDRSIITIAILTVIDCIIGTIVISKCMFQEQIDNPDGSIGYLVLKNYTSILVYHLVADVFFDRKVGEGRAVHHIDNDGYNSSEDNLIMLTEIQHGAIHKNEMKEW